MPKTPALRHNKSAGRAFVELNGTRHYLGPWGAPETQQAYDRLIAEWLANGRKLPVDPYQVTVTEICAEYLKVSERYYVRQDGTPTRTLGQIKHVIKELKRLYGNTKGAEFGPNALRVIRQKWIDDERSVRTINCYTGLIKQIFKWAASHEKIPGSVYQSLQTLNGVRNGRGEGRTTKPVPPVPDKHVDKTIEKASPQVGALIELQRLTGARPGELVGLKPKDFDTTGEVWTVKLDDHKTAYRGRERVLYFGPKAQAVLRPFMLRSADEYLFSPKEAEKARHADAEGHRRDNQKPNPRKTDRTLGDCYTVDSYRRAITRACEKAGVTKWTPNQLRHNAATFIRKQYGLDAAQAILGHSRADVTQVYAEVNNERAKEVIKHIG